MNRHDFMHIHGFINYLDLVLLALTNDYCIADYNTQKVIKSALKRQRSAKVSTTENTPKRRQITWFSLAALADQRLSSAGSPSQVQHR